MDAVRNVESIVVSTYSMIVVAVVFEVAADVSRRETVARTTIAEDVTFVVTNVFIKEIQRLRNTTRCVR